MNTQALVDTAKALVADDKGIHLRLPFLVKLRKATSLDGAAAHF